MSRPTLEKMSVMAVSQRERERTDAHSSDPPKELPPRINVRSTFSGKVDAEKYGPTRREVAVCQNITKESVPSGIVATHVDECRERMEAPMMQDPTRAGRVVRTKTRHEEAKTNKMWNAASAQQPSRDQPSSSSSSTSRRNEHSRQ